MSMVVEITHDELRRLNAALGSAVHMTRQIEKAFEVGMLRGPMQGELRGHIAEIRRGKQLADHVRTRDPKVAS